MKTWSSIDEIKAANKAAGQHFFDDETMEFFDSKIESGVISGRFFITSERFMLDPRRYTVREVIGNDGRVVTASEFNRYETQEDAERAIFALLDFDRF